MGTLAVRYVVQAQGDKNSVLRIDAIFVEDFRHTSHLSNGSVESAEYKDIHDRLDAITVMKTETAEAERQRDEKLTRQFAPAETTRAATPPPTPMPTVESADNSDARRRKQSLRKPRRKRWKNASKISDTRFSDW